MDEIFDREIKLIGYDKYNILKNSKVILFGLGGVGSYVFEGLIRSGILNITIVDFDKVDITNINRQLIADTTTIGEYKVDIATDRAKRINPDVKIKGIKKRYEEGSDFINFKDYDYVIDAIDDVKAKIDIIVKAKENNVKVISSMGTGNKLNPELFKIDDIKKTSVCPLARVIRKELKNRGINDIKVLYSTEEPIKNTNDISSISFVPSIAGLLISSYVVKDLIK